MYFYVVFEWQWGTLYVFLWSILMSGGKLCITFFGGIRMSEGNFVFFCVVCLWSTCIRFNMVFA